MTGPWTEPRSAKKKRWRGRLKGRCDGAATSNQKPGWQDHIQVGEHHGWKQAVNATKKDGEALIAPEK